MKRGPFEHQRHRSPRQLTSDYGECLYFNQGLEFAIQRMEMGRFMIAEVHSNHNPKEPSYLGHLFLILPSPAYAPSETRMGGAPTGRLLGWQHHHRAVEEDRHGWQRSILRVGSLDPKVLRLPELTYDSFLTSQKKTLLDSLKA
jgi:hypothetical protein